MLLASTGYRVCGLDLSPKMVDLARAKAAAARVAVDFIVGDAARPPWQAASFDVALCRHVLWALADPVAALEQWFRLLAPDGRLVLIEGRWWTGAGLPAAAAADLLAQVGATARLMPLPDPALWGSAISDERYLVVAERTTAADP